MKPLKEINFDAENVHGNKSAPRVLNRRHGLGTPRSEYVGRPTVFGNPFVVGKDGSRDDVIAKYEAWLLAQPGLVERAQRHLRGRDLVCWCAPLPCHADVLLRVANAEPLSLLRPRTET